MNHKTLLIIVCCFSCSCLMGNKSGRIHITENRSNSKMHYYYRNDTLVGSRSDIDSIAYIYNKKLLVKIRQFQNKDGHFSETGEANYTYDNNQQVVDVKFSDDFENPYKKCVSSIEVNNKYGLLDKDLCYIDAIFQAAKISVTRLESKKIELDLGIGQLQGSSISPFPFGTKIKQLSVIVSSGNLIELKGNFINEPNNEEIVYAKKYEYNSDGTLSSSITKDLSHNVNIDSITYKYLLW
ncbi:hypothetical protein [Taibaiella chishuiensis]|uniref:Uncharacterized protein n=1 Tax=Taibaiella chishuiensis TaxID=1434707 RepID=A0A2P8D7H9_9BACT|nr:hypothetical protein [Taibaiella chishuiensis]PSK93147.1 hypothetical protein B0I18_102117 [Taibaiella chishuiensis]